MDPSEMVACLDLYVEEPVLGSDTRFVREAGISFGRLTMGPLADDELPALTRRRLDLGKWRFTMVALPFDLQELPGGRRYMTATVRMSFDDPEVRSLSLSRPAATDASEDSSMDTWGVGRGELTWKLSANSEQIGIRPNSRMVLAVLESPLACERTTGTLDAVVCLTRRVLGVPTQSVAEPKRPLRFTLNMADGAFEVAPDQ